MLNHVAYIAFPWDGPAALEVFLQDGITDQTFSIWFISSKLSSCSPNSHFTILFLKIFIYSVHLHILAIFLKRANTLSLG